MSNLESFTPGSEDSELELEEPQAEEKEAEKPEDTKERKEKTDKGIYESIVTNNYFEGWGEIKLEGNAGIEDRIRGNIIQAEKRNQYAYRREAAHLGISVEEFKNGLQAKLEDMVERSDFFIATPSGILDKIMNGDGRWKSQIETGSSEGHLEPTFRAQQEMAMFGFNEQLTEVKAENEDHYLYMGSLPQKIQKNILKRDKEKRPIYGYFSDDEHGAINNHRRFDMSTYGDIRIKVKKERALEKATITFCDTMYKSTSVPPTPSAKPHFTSFPLSYNEGISLDELESTSKVNWDEDYTEAQYHDQLTTDDIESIHIETNNGLSPEDIERVEIILEEYKKRHPESTIQLIKFDYERNLPDS